MDSTKFELVRLLSTMDIESYGKKINISLISPNKVLQRNGCYAFPSKK